jgi:short-subunit dehydrogenase
MSRAPGSTRARSGSPAGTALIPGASSSIGEALAWCFAAGGHDLVLVARSADALKALSASLADTHGVKAWAVRAVNVGALTQMLAHLVPPMVERGHGRVLNVASISAFQPIPALATYAARRSACRVG